MAKLNDAMNPAKTQLTAGLTLIGVLVATMLFATILTATFGLAARTTRDVGRSRENFIATNLAREGLELVQLVRDSNMQRCSSDTTNSQCSSNSAWTENAAGEVPLCVDDGENQLIVDRHDSIPSGVRVQEARGAGGDRLFLAGSRYQHDVTATLTDYSRRIIIDCTNRATADTEHIEVVSRVTWRSRGQEHVMELRNHLYNWYQ